MKIIICGAGQVGGQIARHLAREEGANDVTIIDNNAGLVRRITDAYDVSGVAGFASHPDVLEKAGARDADMVIAPTQSDEVNMVVCQVAHSIFSVPRKIARLRAPAYLNAIYSDLYRRDHLPVDVVISPEYAVADPVMQRLALRQLSELFSTLRAVVVGIRRGGLRALRHRSQLRAQPRAGGGRAHHHGAGGADSRSRPRLHRAFRRGAGGSSARR